MITSIYLLLVIMSFIVNADWFVSIVGKIVFVHAM